MHAQNNHCQKKIVMTKADIVSHVSNRTGVEKAVIQNVVEQLMEVIKTSMIEGENIYLRGFGSFILKRRAQKKARNISKGSTIIIPEHYIPYFKPARSFLYEIKAKTKK